MMLPSVLGMVLSLVPAQDATLYEDPSGAFANGSGDWLFVGRTKQAENSLRRATLQFDVAGALPEGAEILSVELRMFVSQSISGGSPVGLFPLQQMWSEGSSDSSGIGGGGSGAVSQAGDATWIHSVFPDSLWGEEGGDFEDLADASAMAGGASSSAPVVWAGEAMTARVQEWLDQPTTNQGWALIGDEVTAGSAKRLNSREHPDAATRPELLLTWRAIPETSSLLLVAVSAIAALGLRRRARNSPHNA